MNAREGAPGEPPRLLSVNSYHYRRGGADAVYFDHAALLESLGWQNAFFAMHHPQNIASPWDRYFCDEIQFGHDYSIGQKLVKAGKVVYSFEARRRLRELFADFRPDVAHLHNIYHHQSPSILSVLTAAGVPVVMTAHDLKIACPNNKMLTANGICERCRVHRYWNVVQNACVQNSRAASAIVAAEATLHAMLGSYRRHVDRIIVPSHFFLRKFVEWGWPESKFVYIPNYVDADAFTPTPITGRHFLYFGRIAQEKGVLTLIRAAAEAGVSVRIAGTGPLDAQAQALITELRADVQMLGFRRGEALFDEIRAARAVVLPSEWYENAPLSVLESLAMARPVIGAQIGGIPEMVREGQSGWLFPSGDVARLADRLRTVADLPDAAVQQLGDGGRELVRTAFSRQGYIDAILGLYRSLGVRMPARVAV